MELARQVKDESQQMFLVGAVVSISDKFIDKAYVQQLMEVMKMTRVGELLYKEARQEGEQRGRQEGEQRGRQEAKVEVARNLLKMGIEMERIMQATGLMQQEIEALKEKA